MFFEISYPESISESDLVVMEGVMTMWYGKSGRAWINKEKYRFIVLDREDHLRTMLLTLGGEDQGLALRKIGLDDESLTRDEADWMEGLRDQLVKLKKLFDEFGQ